ncbi:MAG: hypothetical protein LC808_26040 [Actinobacteria bacterium]|nr:hypothetical protein [Actinomycetota bacterium]
MSEHNGPALPRRSVQPDPLSPDSAAKVAEIHAQMLAAVTAAGARRERRATSTSRRSWQRTQVLPAGLASGIAPGTNAARRITRGRGTGIPPRRRQRTSSRPGAVG